MLYRIYCFLTKIAHVGIEIFNRKHRILRYKIFPNPTKILVKSGGLSYRIHCILQNFRMWGQKNTIQQNSALQNISYKKGCKWGQTLYWSSSNQYERHSASTTHKKIGVKKWENKKAGVNKKRDRNLVQTSLKK